jgi:hypothetical protein
MYIPEGSYSNIMIQFQQLAYRRYWQSALFHSFDLVNGHHTAMERGPLQKAPESQNRVVCIMRSSNNHNPRDPATRCASRASAFFISTERTLCANVRVHSVSLMLSAVGRKCTSISVFESPLSESCQHSKAKRKSSGHDLGRAEWYGRDCMLPGERQHKRQPSTHLEQRRELRVAIRHVGCLLCPRRNDICQCRERFVDVLRFLHRGALGLRP